MLVDGQSWNFFNLISTDLVNELTCGNALPKIAGPEIAFVGVA
jgi:hypothetical protein